MYVTISSIIIAPVLRGEEREFVLFIPEEYWQ